MDYLLTTFKAVSLIFAIASVITGARAVSDPVGFSTSFGLPLGPSTNDPAVARTDNRDPSSTTQTVDSYDHHRDMALSYVSLMGVRQLGTGIVLLTFAYQSKWTEVATILAIIGVVVAGTDGYHLARHRRQQLAKWHAIPGAVIAALAAAVIYSKV